MKILIMGLPGSGKTTLAKQLLYDLSKKNKSVLWLNADEIRKQYDDWDFSEEGRIRQARRMSNLANDSDKDIVIADFVAPLPIMREIYNADMTIWVDTISEGRFEDTNKVFIKPSRYDIRVSSMNCKEWSAKILAILFTRKTESSLRSFIKALTWRFTGTLDTFIISWVITGIPAIALGIAGIEIFTKIFLYWLHERAWNNVSWGKN